MNFLPPDKAGRPAGIIRNTSIEEHTPPLVYAAGHRGTFVGFSVARTPLEIQHTQDLLATPYKRKKRQVWTEGEDQMLADLVKQAKTNKPNWPQIAQKVNKNIEVPRTGKQCRERWQNHLRPNIKKGNWSLEEEAMIHRLYEAFGPRWSCMAKMMRNRTDNDIKNKWNSMRRAKVTQETKESYSQVYEKVANSTSGVPAEMHPDAKQQPNLEAKKSCRGSFSDNTENTPSAALTHAYASSQEPLHQLSRCVDETPKANVGNQIFKFQNTDTTTDNQELLHRQITLSSTHSWEQLLFP